MKNRVQLSSLVEEATEKLNEGVADWRRLSKAKSKRLIDEVLADIRSNLSEGTSVVLPKLGTLFVREVNVRKRPDESGSKLVRLLKFKPSTHMKKLVRQEDHDSSF